jgi:rare lipoprotein A (peptidoglycan hydrolase)
VFHTIVGGLVFSLCILGSTKGAYAFDISNSTTEDVTQVSFEDERVELPQSISLQRSAVTSVIVEDTKHYPQRNQHNILKGIASWYGKAFHGKRTASGEFFNQYADTLAHLTLPLGTEVLVENPRTGVSVRARVNDRGPYVIGRIADLSYGLASKLGIIERGRGAVIITVL